MCVLMLYVRDVIEKGYDTIFLKIPDLNIRNILPDSHNVLSLFLVAFWASFLGCEALGMC